jgi:hypothetical protein
MSGRCRDHLYSRAMQHGSRGVCVRCGGHEPVRGIITDRGLDLPPSRPSRALSAHSIEDAFHVPAMASELYPDGYDGA